MLIRTLQIAVLCKNKGLTTVHIYPIIPQSGNWFCCCGIIVMKKGKSATKPVPRPQNVVQYCTVYLYIHCAKYPVPFFSLKLMAGLKVAHTVCAIYYVILWYNMNIPQLGCYCVLIYYEELNNIRGLVAEVIIRSE